jgi:multisubunit Na+/H+ antiporter MnhC subunit
MLLTLFIVAIVMIFVVGFYSLIVTRNLIRVVISLELLTKAVTLLTILVGALTHQMAQAQAFAVTLIVIEVIVTAIAAGIIINVYNHTGSVDTRKITDLKE